MLDPKKTLVRALSGAVYVALIVLACWWGVLGVILLAGCFGAIGITEFRKMRFQGEPAGGLNLYDVIGGVALIFCSLPSATGLYAFGLVWIAWLVGRMVLTIYSRHPHPERVFAVDMAAQCYIAFPLALLVAISQHLFDAGESCLPILSMFILIWVNDTGAFLVGSTIGRHPLFPRVSPKKSWEGFWGGLVFSAIIGFIIGYFRSPLSGVMHDPVLFWTLGGILISLASTFGDLFESVIKRNLNLKDSGNLIPGHGGILDRIDSLLMVIPVTVLYYIFYNLYL